MNATRYYVSRKNPLTWVSSLMALAAAVLQILGWCHGTDGLNWVDVFFQRVLPIWVALGYVFIVLVRGPEEFYRVTKPVFWGCVYFGAVALDWYFRLQADPGLADSLSSGYSLFAYKRYVALCWFLYLVMYIVIRMIMTGKLKRSIFFPVFMAIPTAILTYDLVGATQLDFYIKLSNVLLVGAVFVITLVMKPFADGKYHRCWGDRPDGRLVRSVDGMALLAGYFMPDRNDACNSIRDTIEISAIERYIHKKRAEGLKGFGIMHVLLATYVRCVAKYPGLNRFFSGQRVHQRDDEIIFIMVVKKDMTTDAPDTSIKLHLNVRDTAEDVYHKLNAEIEKVKKGGEESGLDSAIGIFNCIPGLLLKFTVWVLKVLDYFGKLPKFLLELSPFHGSVIFTSMGSLGIPPVTHHLYNFGNLPVFLAFGRKYRKTELTEDGEAVTRRYVDISMNTDERTVDGFYYATVLKYFHKICRNPSQLDAPPAEVIADIE